MTYALLSRLQSREVEEQIAATYELGRQHFASPDIVEAVRGNLNSTNNDLVEISIMRLLIRGDDAQSADRVLAILRSTQDDLIFSAGVLGLSSLARKFLARAARTITILEELLASQSSTDRRNLLNEQLAELS